MSAVKQLEQELNQMILSGQALEAFEKFYADDLVMQENDQPLRIGKAANREFEEQFFGSIKEFHGATLGDVAVDGDISFSEWTFRCHFPRRQPSCQSSGNPPQMERWQSRSRAFLSRLRAYRGHCPAQSY